MAEIQYGYTDNNTRNGYLTLVSGSSYGTLISYLACSGEEVTILPSIIEDKNKSYTGSPGSIKPIELLKNCQRLTKEEINNRVKMFL